ncbi:hypothetical protein HRI_002246300 [Hibiscus trionum]|uniref:Uncharacterized protein n=1 Tax=Hibiscus trionum TaxID=183268 RepID=A0A9W7HWN2_HIBTR|nr:hypothetical protein HRI_002246300 [Hibiscus trionum]
MDSIECQIHSVECRDAAETAMIHEFLHRNLLIKRGMQIAMQPRPTTSPNKSAKEVKTCFLFGICHKTVYVGAGFYVVKRCWGKMKVVQKWTLPLQDMF